MLKQIALAAAVVALAGTAAFAADANKIAIVVGGPHPYFSAMEQSAADAKAELGIGDVAYKVPQAWDLGQQNKMIESMVSSGYNGMVLFPGDAVGTGTEMGELQANNIPSGSIAACVTDPSPSLFCMATDVYASAYQGTKKLIEAMGGKGAIVHLTGLLVDPNTQLRIQAVQKAVAEAGSGVTILQVIADIDAPQPADEKINAFLATRASEVNGIISTAWIPSVVASTSLRNIGDKRIKMVAIDHDPIVLAAIKDGFVNGTMLQNPYGQAYLGAYVIDKVVSGCTIKADAPFATTSQTKRFIDTGTLFIGADQVDNYVHGLKSLTADLKGTMDSKFLSCP